MRPKVKPTPTHAICVKDKSGNEVELFRVAYADRFSADAAASDVREVLKWACDGKRATVFVKSLKSEPTQ